MYDFARVYVTFLCKNALFALLNLISNNVYYCLMRFSLHF